LKQNIDKLSKYYQNENIEYERLSDNRTDQLEKTTTLRYLNMLIPKEAAVLDACAAYGVYAFPLAEKGYKVTAGGHRLSPC